MAYMARILVFTEGTIIMHENAVGRTREEVVNQVVEGDESIRDYSSYVSIGDAPQKLRAWRKQGAEIMYLTSRTKLDEIKEIEGVLRKHGFPDGRLFYRQKGDEYKDVAERIKPDILIEDDCESIGGTKEMTITHVNPELKKKIKSITVKEFGGIDHLLDEINAL